MCTVRPIPIKKPANRLKWEFGGVSRDSA
jgi:hypothetical protein